MKMKKHRHIVLEIFLAALAILHLYPICLIALSAFKTTADLAQNPFGLPKEFVIENFVKAFDQMDYLRSAMNSLIVTFFSVTLLIVMSAATAYCIIRRNTRFYRILYMVFLFGLIVPYQMIMIPLYRIIKDMGLMSSYQGLILVYLAIFAPFSVFLFSGFVKTIPLELEEAAALDGCGIYRTFFSIVFPLLQPAMATIAVLNVFHVWNDFLQPLMFVQERKMNTLVIQIYQFVGEFSNKWPLIFAAICMIVVPIMIIFLFSQKYVINGITAGAVKG